MTALTAQKEGRWLMPHDDRRILIQLHPAHSPGPKSHPASHGTCSGHSVFAPGPRGCMQSAVIELGTRRPSLSRVLGE